MYKLDRISLTTKNYLKCKLSAETLGDFRCKILAYDLAHQARNQDFIDFIV